MNKSKITIITIVLSCVIVTALGQSNYIKGAYHLPKQHRQEIITRLNLLIEYERTGQYELQYNLIDKEVIRSNGWAKEEYVLRQKERAANTGVIQTISLEKVIKLDENHIGIGGTAKMHYRDQKVSQSIGIVATLQEGQWHFGFGFVET